MGSHALLPCVLLLAEPSQLLCPPRPQLRYWAPTGGSEGGRSPGRLIVQKAAPPAPSAQPEFPGWGEGNSRALRGAQGPGAKPSRGAASPHPVHGLARCMLCSPHTCRAAPADPEVHTVKCIFLLVLIPEDFMGVAKHQLEPEGTQEHPGGHEMQACPSA